MKYLLFNKGLVDPRSIRLAQDGEIIGVITNGMVESAIVPLYFNEECPYNEGTHVVIGFGRNFFCESLEDIEQERVNKEQRRLARQSQEKKESIERRLAANVFNDALNIPFKWSAGFKPVLSGLSQNSLGNGMNRATVIHIQLKEDYKCGRLMRDAGDFLCTKNLGKQWLDDASILLTDAKGVDYYPKITCKACLARIHNLNRQNNKQKT